MRLVQCVTAALCCALVHSVRYEPNWTSLDTRPLPAWYDQGKIGVFIHWGVFSVPSFGSEWFWAGWHGKAKAFVEFMQKNYPPNFTYADFAKDFTAEFYSPDQWANIFKAAGAKYVVLVTKHHEGFTNWPSKFSWNWNSGDVGPNRDLVGDLAAAIRNHTDIHFGLYHSMFEFFNPLFLQDQANHYRTQDYVKTKTLPELYELVNKYHPDVLWSDGEWMAPDTYWNSPEFIAWLYNDSPVKDTVVINDRWGNNTRCKHGGFWNCKDHYRPTGLMTHKWESCVPIDQRSWGYRRDAVAGDFINIHELLYQLVTTVSYGGNFLVNIGPTKDGMIGPIFEERLRQMGEWLSVNGDAIYNSTAWTYQNETGNPDVWYTAGKTGHGEPCVFAILLKWPKNDTLTLTRPRATEKTQVTLLGYPDVFTYKMAAGGGMVINIPPIPESRLPGQWAWTLRITSPATLTHSPPPAPAKDVRPIAMFDPSDHAHYPMSRPFLQP